MHNPLETIILTPRQLGPVLQGWRKYRKLTQRELGAQVGLSQVAISKLESEPETSAVERLLRTLSGLGLEVVLRERRADGAPTGEEW